MLIGWLEDHPGIIVAALAVAWVAYRLLGDADPITTLSRPFTLIVAVAGAFGAASAWRNRG